MTETFSESLREPIRRRVGRGLSARRTLERIEALRASATALLASRGRAKMMEPLFEKLLIALVSLKTVPCERKTAWM